MINDAQVVMAGFVASAPSFRRTTRATPTAKRRVAYPPRHIDRSLDDSPRHAGVGIGGKARDAAGARKVAEQPQTVFELRIAQRGIRR